MIFEPSSIQRFRSYIFIMMVVVDELTVRCLLEARRPLVRVQVREAGGLLPHVMHLLKGFIVMIHNDNSDDNWKSNQKSKDTKIVQGLSLFFLDHLFD